MTRAAAHIQLCAPSGLLLHLRMASDLAPKLLSVIISGIRLVRRRRRLIVGQ